MKLWLILLGVAIGLGIALRRVLRRQSPLSDELYSKQVAVAHVQSGVAWVRGDLTFGSVNQAFADTFGMSPGDFAGREWYKVFVAEDHARIRECYGQMILMGMVTFEASGQRADGSLAWLRVRLVAVHDGRMRFVGHQCMIDDKTRERDLERQVRALEERLEEGQREVARVQLQRLEQQLQTAAVPSTGVSGPPIEPIEPPQRATGRSVVSALNSLRKSAKPESVSPLIETR